MKICVLCCSSSFDPVELMRACSESEDKINVISLPCSGKVDILYLTKAFESGIDGVAIVTCKQDECRYLEGNLRAKKRAEAIDELLDEIGLGRGRMTIISMSDDGIKHIIQELEDFIHRLKELPRQKQNNEVSTTIPNLKVPVFGNRI